MSLCAHANLELVLALAAQMRPPLYHGCHSVLSPWKQLFESAVVPSSTTNTVKYVRWIHANANY